MAELATPAGWLLAKNTHRVFFYRSALPSGQIHHVIMQSEMTRQI
jgi:hypothetical protein